MCPNLLSLETVSCIKLHLFLQDCILVMLLILYVFHNKLVGENCSETKSHSIQYFYHVVLQYYGFWGSGRGREKKWMCISVQGFSIVRLVFFLPPSSGSIKVTQPAT